MGSEYEYVRLLPWVGERYSEAKLRILILGVKIHSYDPGSVGRDVTTELVDYYLMNHDDKDNIEGYFDTYDRTIDIVREDAESREDAWRRVIFYNFTQEPLLKNAEFPNDEQINYGLKALEEIINKYCPNKILIMGKKLNDVISHEIGERAQDLGIRRTHTVAVPNSESIVHICYYNDPSHKDFNVKQWRQWTRQFLESTPRPHKDPHIRRNIRKILSFLQIKSNEFVISSSYTLLDVLSRAVHNGILRLDPPFAEPEGQRLKAESTIATAYFALCLRDYVHTKDVSHKAIRGISSIFETLLMVENFDIEVDETNSQIIFTGKNKGQVAKIYNAIRNNRLQNEPRRIEWKFLEELFETKNLRQYRSDIRRDKDYVEKIDRFFNDKYWKKEN